MSWLNGYKLDDTFVQCYRMDESPTIYTSGKVVPHFPLPVRRNMDINSPYWYWLFITMLLLRMKN